MREKKISKTNKKREKLEGGAQRRDRKWMKKKEITVNRITYLKTRSDKQKKNKRKKNKYRIHKTTNREARRIKGSKEREIEKKRQ